MKSINKYFNKWKLAQALETNEEKKKLIDDFINDLCLISAYLVDELYSIKSSLEDIYEDDSNG